MRIIFMGTAEFAVPTLKTLTSSHEVLAVVTAADKPAGRGHKMQTSEVKKFALSNDLLVLQPNNLKSSKFLRQLKELNADIFIVVAFRMLPEMVWSLPPYGSLNLHASLLPKYRGAAPIQRAIMNGETKTGLTVFKLNSQIDTGELILQCEVKIAPNETGGELHDKLKILGGDLILESLKIIMTNNRSFIKQDDSRASSAPKIFREDCMIQWEHYVDHVYNHIRALIPYPCAWFIKDGIQYKIHSCEKVLSAHTLQASTFYAKDNSLLIACTGGYIKVHEIQPEGKRKMTALEFLNGLQNRNF